MIGPVGGFDGAAWFVHSMRFHKIFDFFVRAVFFSARFHEFFVRYHVNQMEKEGFLHSDAVAIWWLSQDISLA